MHRSIRYLVFYALLLFCFSGTLFSQKVSYDNLGKYWLIEDNRIVCVSESDRLKPTFSRIVLGNPTSVDASDPFKILVFYQNTQTVAIISNDAVLIGKPVELFQFNIGEASCSTRSSLGGIWLAIQGAQKIIRLDKHLKQTEQTIKLPSRYAKFAVIQITEYNGELYVGLEDGSVVAFDTYGALVHEYTYEPFSNFLIDKNRVFIAKKGEVFEYSLFNSQELLAKYKCDCADYITITHSLLACYDGQQFNFCEKFN
ncbi:MAG: hypothetical protein PHW91_00960 [Bacteroidales bacterium]|nr:hypothetical protein [Bacteroidales bacterium]